MSRLAKILCFVVVLTILAWFAAQNMHKVAINYFEGKPIPLLGHERAQDGSRQARPIPVYLLVLGCIFIGCLVGGLALLGPQLRLVRENQELKRKIGEQREELDVLRRIPIGQAEEEEETSQDLIPTA